MANEEILRVIVFHKADTATKAASALAASFPKASAIFGDLIAAKSQGVAASYITEADRADAPLNFPNLGITLGYARKSQMKTLRQDPTASFVARAPSLSQIRPVRIAEASLTTDLTWGIKALGVEQLWKQGLTGKGVAVGHLDTGVDATHPALKGRVAEFAEWDFLGRKRPGAKPHDSAMHGTHTAGTICGGAVGGRAVGVAPGAKLCSGLVIEGGDLTARILGGLDWLVGLGVRVISMSLGFRGYDPVFKRLIDLLIGRDIVPVFAIGNEGPNTSRSPANYPESLAIGAIDSNGQTALFSGSQHFDRKDDPDKPDCVAPGVQVISAKPGGGWQEMDGTSMATPHVAGIVALLLEAKPDAKAPAIRKALLDSAKDIGGEPALRHGRGMIQPVEALKLLTAAQTPAPAASSAARPRSAVKSKRARRA
jgi:subtilisin family serine protease